MTFYPAIPLGGYAGWRIFNRSADQQRETFAGLQTVQRDIDYLRAHIGDALTSESLIGDRRLLRIALTAFGLESEIDKKAYIRRVLDDGTDRGDAFANRINDPRWREFSRAFGYGNITGPRTLLDSFNRSLATMYVDRAFEARVGDVSADMRLALNFRREIVKIANHPDADRIGWFQIMGQRPLRAVMEAALGLPASLGAIDIDKQNEIFSEAAARQLGDPSAAAFRDPANVEDAIRKFFLRRDLEGGAASNATRGAAALALLTGAGVGPYALSSLLASNAAGGRQ